MTGPEGLVEVKLTVTDTATGIGLTSLALVDPAIIPVLELLADPDHAARVTFTITRRERATSTGGES